MKFPLVATPFQTPKTVSNLPVSHPHQHLGFMYSSQWLKGNILGTFKRRRKGNRECLQTTIFSWNNLDLSVRAAEMFLVKVTELDVPLLL